MKKVVASLVFSSLCMSSSDVFAESALKSANGLRSMIESKIKNLKKVSEHFKKGYAAQGKKSRRKKRVSTKKVPTKRELIRFVQKVGSKVTTAVKKPEVQLALLGTSAAVAGSAAAAAYSSTNLVEALITKFGSSKIAADPITANSIAANSTSAPSIAANSTSAASIVANSTSAAADPISVAADPGFWARSLSTVKAHPWISTAIATGICAIPTITLAIKAFNKKGPINAEFEEGLGDNASNSECEESEDNISIKQSNEADDNPNPEGEKVTPVTENPQDQDPQNQKQIERDDILKSEETKVNENTVTENNNKRGRSQSEPTVVNGNNGNPATLFRSESTPMNQSQRARKRENAEIRRRIKSILNNPNISGEKRAQALEAIKKKYGVTDTRWNSLYTLALYDSNHGNKSNNDQAPWKRGGAFLQSLEQSINSTK